MQLNQSPVVRSAKSHRVHARGSVFTRTSVGKLTAAALILLALQSTLSAATYYVAKSGSDSNPGSSTLPWLTIQKAANTAVAGDTVKVAAGKYAEQVKESSSGTSDARIIFQGEGAGSVTVGGFYFTGAFISVDGFAINGSGVPLSQAVVHLEAGARNAAISNLAITGTYSMASGPAGVTSYAANCSFSKLTIVDANGHAFSLIGDGSTVSASTINIRNGWDAFRIVGSNIRITDCHVTLSNMIGNANNHPDFVQAFNVSGTNLSKNVIIENTFAAGHAYTPNDATQLGNIEDDKRDGSISGWTFRNNVFVNIPRVFNLSAPGFAFYNNTFYRCGVGSNWALIWADNKGIPTGTKIKNNLFVECGDPLSPTRGWYGGAAFSGIECDYNLVVGTGSGTTKGSNFYNNGYEVRGVNGKNPLFVDPANNDFRLQAGSSAIGAGVPLNGLFTEDRTGVTRGATWDIGAHQFAAGSVSPSLAAPSNARVAATP